MNNLLLTGGAGFIGHHTVEHILKNTDWNIYLIDRLTYAGKLNRLTEIDCWEKEKSRVKFIYHDLRSPLLSIYPYLPNIDYVIHMAAESHVEASLKEPRLFADSNTMGTINVLEMARDFRVQKMIYVSTDEVFGGVISGQLHKEGESYNPSNPYAASKAGGEAFCKAYAKSFMVPVMITNTMNNFGERQEPEKFVPKVIASLVEGKPIELHCKYKDGVVDDISSRCWLHARNHADALLFLLNNYMPEQGVAESFNVVGQQHDVFDMTERIANYMDLKPNIKFIDFHSFRPGHDMHYGLDGTKMQELGWKPPVDFDESLKKTIRWYSNHSGWLWR